MFYRLHTLSAYLEVQNSALEETLESIERLEALKERAKTNTFHFCMNLKAEVRYCHILNAQ